MLKHIRQTTPGRPALLGGRTGDRKSKAVLCALRARFFDLREEGVALLSDFGFQGLVFPSPERRLDNSPTSGGLGEHCPSSAVRHGVCASLGRVAQPRLLTNYRGNPEGAANRGRLFFGYFLFGEAKESD